MGLALHPGSSTHSLSVPLGTVERVNETARGALIVFEGGDGAGKSTQVQAVARALESQGRTVIRTREPGGTPLAESVRGLVLDPAHAPVDPHTEALLFASARADHVNRFIRPAMERGDVVISDRFVDSSVAYQGAARGLGVEHVQELNEWALRGLTPDLTVLLDVDTAVAEDRRTDRGLAADRMEGEDRNFHAVVNQAFRDLAAAAPERYLVLAADQPVQVITDRILERLSEVLS